MAKKTIEAVARELADSHREDDPKTVAVYLAADPSASEVRLVEVSGAVGTIGQVLPFRFKAREDLGVPYPSALILLSESEWQDLQNGALTLPREWGLIKDLKQLFPAA